MTIASLGHNDFDKLAKCSTALNWRRRLWIIGLAVAIVWYPTLTWLLGFTPWTKLDFGLAFNSMAEHLLAGRFDVDPQAIGAEGFDINGRTVSYFGIFCALRCGFRWCCCQVVAHGPT